MNLKQKQFIDTFIGMPLVYLNLILAKTLGWLLHRNHSLEVKPPQEIVFIKILGFGSVLMASDAIYSIQKTYPGTRISILCSRGIADGIAALNLFDKMYIIEDQRFTSTVFSTLSIVKTLWATKNKWVVDLEVYSKLTSIVSLWTMAINRFGFYHNPVAFRFNLNTHNIYFNTVVQVEENYKRMAEALGVSNFIEFMIPGVEPKASHKEYIVINNTCSELSPERKLSHEQFIALCNWLKENTSYKVALLGAPSDRHVNEMIIHQTNYSGQIENLAGQLSFNEYFNFLVSSCRLMITIDSAPLHIANKLGVPNISIWGPTTPASRINLQSKNPYIYLSATCSPCAHFTDVLPCKGDNFCIKHITTQQLTSTISSMLDQIDT